MIFKVGDRVNVYRNGSLKPITGTIQSIPEHGLLSIIEDGFYSSHSDSPFHPKQCRKLKSRRRTIMLHSEDVNRVLLGLNYHSAARPINGLHNSDEAIAFVEFQEVKRK